jgi:hypothetical protein
VIGMPVWRLQTSFGFDTAFPRDKMMITPHFDDHGALSDPDGLCEDLATALDTWNPGTCEITVKAYDAKGTPPVFPAGEHVVNLGNTPVTSVPREICLCLSFYAERNRPRYRGRLYIPCAAFGAAMALRPSAPNRTKVGDLVPIFAGLGGVDVDWVVFSRTDNTARKVTNWWVDDEWDIQRRRGMRPTTRLEGGTSG